MKKIKKIQAILLAVSIIVINIFSFSSVSYAADNTKNTLDILEVLLITSSFLNGVNQEDSVLTDKSTVGKVIPLYNENGSTVAFYATFNPDGYAVVNNNCNNPTVIEFGRGRNAIIEQILESDIKPHIIYNNPTEIYNLDKKIGTKRLTQQRDIYAYYPELNETDETAVSHLTKIKENVSINNLSRSAGDYGFIDWLDMPSGSYDTDIIIEAALTDWVTTGDFNSFANNHCGAVAITNLALYFAERGHSNLKVGTNYNTFMEVYDIVGDGPEVTIAGNAKKFFSDRGYTLKSSSVLTYAGIIDAISKDHPCGVLLENSLLDWHWVIAVGYRDYGGTGRYMRIVNGWDDSIDVFYKANTGSGWVSTTEYWVQ